MESMEYTDARFMQKSVWPIEGLTEVSLYCWRYYLSICSYIYVNTGNKIVIYQLQNANSDFPKFCKVYALQKNKIWYIYLHIYLVETIALILLSKIVFKKCFWLKLFILKNTLHALNPLIPRGNKRSHILK